MTFSKFFDLSMLALGLVLASPAIACVSYSSNLNYDGDVLNAALTDDGVQRCAIINMLPGQSSIVTMSCDDGYQATIDLDAAVVSYSYPGFSGSFGTTYTQYANGNGAYYTAQVWC